MGVAVVMDRSKCADVTCDCGAVYPPAGTDVLPMRIKSCAACRPAKAMPWTDYSSRWNYNDKAPIIPIYIAFYRGLELRVVGHDKDSWSWLVRKAAPPGKDFNKYAGQVFAQGFTSSKESAMRVAETAHHEHLSA